MRCLIKLRAQYRAGEMLKEAKKKEQRADGKGRPKKASDQARLHPLIVDGELMLIDGRNPREACKRAEVTPRAKPLEKGKDPVAYIFSANINRRHLTVGQRAMLTAVLWPEGRHGKTPTQLGFSVERLRQARFILRHAADLLDPVRNGTMQLNAAYEEARNRKLHAEGDVSVMQRLRAEAPDLADLVIEERMSLHEAAVALEARKERESTHRYCTWKVLSSWMNFISSYKDGHFAHLNGHWEEFRDITQKTRQGLIAALERFHKDLPAVLTALRNQED